MTDIASSASEPDTSTSRAASEYERERVPNSALKGPSAFWGMYAGEHTAGTEFMIGPLFVAWGADAASLIFGLLLGNLLAVLTWRYLTAQIACSDRLTLYYTMERIAGRGLVTLYNLANGLLFCFLAGSMITVSATAVGPLFPPGMIEMPTFESTLPTGIAWILSCVVIGSLMTLVALKGYGVVAQVGHYAAPWMFLVFVACALVTLGKLGTTDIWQLLTPPAGTEQKIWLHRSLRRVRVVPAAALRDRLRPALHSARDAIVAGASPEPHLTFEEPSTMRPVARLVGLAALAATIVPPAPFMIGRMPEASMKAVMLAAAVTWFAAAPFWMKVE